LATRGFFASLLRPLLVLLLVVGSVTAERVRAADRTLGGIDHSFRLLGLDCEQTIDDLVEARSEPDSYDGNDLPDLVALAADPTELVPDLVRLSQAGQAAYPAAPRHRPCAAPPTGPPLA
jgi:hypothetical protein